MEKGGIMACGLIAAVLIITTSSYQLVSAYDPSPLQDFCVAPEGTSSVNVNGLTCKDPGSVSADDFLFRGLHIPGNTSNPFGALATTVTGAKVPGLNTMGISIGRVDFAPGGVNPPHSHPRSSELFLVLEGTFEVGFISSSPESKLFSKVLQVGDIFAIPAGLVHFQHNLSSKNGLGIVVFNSQNPGLVLLGNTLLGSNFDADLLAKTFQVDKDTISLLPKF